jgi:hypothetical protein
MIEKAQKNFMDYYTTQRLGCKTESCPGFMLYSCETRKATPAPVLLRAGIFLPHLRTPSF